MEDSRMEEDETFLDFRDDLAEMLMKATPEQLPEMYLQFVEGARKLLPMKRICREIREKYGI